MEHTIPCDTSISIVMPNVGPALRTIVPSEPTFIAVAIVCALKKRRAESAVYLENVNGTHSVKSMDAIKTTWPVMLAHPVIQLASGAHRAGASFAEK